MSFNISNNNFDFSNSSSNSNNVYSDSNDKQQNNNNAQLKRTRITRACDTCRRKKIKCDVDSKQPCTTCSQYGWECTFKDTAKKRGPPKGYIENLENRLEKMEKLLKRIGSDEDENTTTTKKRTAEEEPRREKTKVFRYHGSSSGYYLVGNILGDEQEKEEQRKMYIMRSFNGQPDYRFRRVNVNDDDLMVVRDATADEVADQQAEDNQEAVDDIIPRSLLSSLISSFFKLGHTAIPVIDKEEYLDAFEGKTTPPPAPLLTYAICTYACFLLKSDDHIFKSAGVERDYVFQTLLERATILVRKEYLKPRIVTIQALVLLCAHPTYSTSSYRNWILAGMAVRMAQDLGLHRTLTTVDLSYDQRERNKQLWYAVYTTDRWCCAVMGRPLAIADSDCDVDLPSVSGARGNEDLTMFVNFVKLSGILGEILRRIYSPRAKVNGYKTKAMEQTVYSLQKMLEEWFNHVPDGYKVTASDLKELNAYPKDSKKLVEGGPLTICYHAVVSLLHRPFIVLENDNNSRTSFEICRQAAKQAVDIARSIPYMTIANFGWNFAAYSVFQAALIHLYNCTNSDPEISKEAKRYVKMCTESCLEPLSKDIPAGPPLIPFLQTLSKLIAADDGGIAEAVRTETTVEEASTQIPSMGYSQQQQSYFPMQDSPTSFQTTPMSSQQGYLASLTEDSGQSWLLNGNNGSALSQAAWQQLFTTPGTPFGENGSSKRMDAQGWESFFMENQSNSNIFM